MANSTINKPIEILTRTITGTTNAQGALAIQGGVSGVHEEDLVLSVSCTNDTSVLAIPWKYNNDVWYAKCVNWQSMSAMPNHSVTVVVKCIPNGHLL